MARRKPVAVQVFPLHTVQTLRSGRGGEDRVSFSRCVEGQESKIQELWTFAEDGTREVHLLAWIQIIEIFTADNFQTNFINAEGRQVVFLGRKSVNVSVQ